MPTTSERHDRTHRVVPHRIDTAELELIRLKLERHNRILEHLVRGASLESVLTMLVELAEETRDGMLGSILLLNPHTRRLTHGAGKSLPSEFRDAISGLCIGPSVGSCGTAAFSKERIVVTDIHAHPYWKDYLSVAKAAGLRACWSEPILSSAGEVLGTFAMYYREPRHPESDDLRFVSECANLAALAIERFRADEAIRESRRSHDTLIRNLPGAAYRCRNDDDWTMEFISDGVEPLSGYEAADLMNGVVSWNSLIVPDDRQRVRTGIQNSLRQRTSFKIEYSITHRDGSLHEIWEQGGGVFADDGSFIAIEGFMADVTEKNQSQADVSFLAALVKSSSDAIFGTDLEGRIISANPAAVRLTGYSRNVLIGTRVQGTSVPEGWQEAYAAIERAREEGTTLNNFEVSVLSKDGELRDLSVSFTPVREADGKLIGSAITLRDQTEFNATRAKLVQAERLAATGQMISAIAHESRNALQRIQIGVDMLGFDLPEDADSRQDLRRISRAKDDLHHLFEDLRNYAAPLKLECQRCSVANVWRQAWSSLESTRAGRDVTLIEHTGGISSQFAEESICNDDRKLETHATHDAHKLEARATELDCEVDAFRLEQVFRNLFENSLSACNDPIEITIRCRDTWIDGRPALAICVEDNGPGLTPDQRVQMFDAFFTTKQKGTGLGMTIAQRIMSAHFGTISVGSAESGGACIELVLPRSFC